MFNRTTSLVRNSMPTIQPKPLERNFNFFGFSYLLNSGAPARMKAFGIHVPNAARHRHSHTW